MTADAHRAEIRHGQRFAFGRNWKGFLRTLSDKRIALAIKSLQDMLGEAHLEGKTFLDIGSGSGLFSLAARRLGARVVSFDYDPDSVTCTATLRQRFYPDSPEWIVERGSVLDNEYLARLGAFDVVYSWGVLHHTGNMWQAFENVKPLVKPGGKLFIAIYNDLGAITDRWETVKRRYNSLPRWLALPYAAAIIAREEWPQLRQAVVQRRLGTWVDTWRNYADRSTRGMNRWFDWIDWIGGYPYERAAVERVVDHFARDGFELTRLCDRSGGYGCNEFVFKRVASMGTWVETRLPGGTSFVRRYGWRVIGPFEAEPRGFYGKAPALSGDCSSSDWVLFRNGRLMGDVVPEPQGRFRIAAPGEVVGDDDTFYVVAARVVEAAQPFIHERGKMWSWAVPELEALADNAQPPNQSPVYVFEKGLQLPFPHSLHDDIAREGGGRFSHWGRYVYFSTLSGMDPNLDRSRFKLVVPIGDRESGPIYP